MVREIWFEKSGLRKVVDQKKRWFYTIIPHFFWFEKSGWPEKKIRLCRTTFVEPLFYTCLEKWLQNKWSSTWGQDDLVLLLFCVYTLWFFFISNNIPNWFLPQWWQKQWLCYCFKENATHCATFYFILLFSIDFYVELY